jgi:cobalt-zinc-cadmium resistance protein CzcA
MNGILILTYFNHLVAEGEEPGEAMRHAAEQQMRPMLMMALSACIGLLPAAVATGIGSQVQRPLATVIVGGMLLGPIMLLVVVPALSLLFLGKDEGGPGPWTPGTPRAARGEQIRADDD